MEKRKLFVFFGVVSIMVLASALFINASIGEDRFSDGIKHVKITTNSLSQKLLSIEHGGGYSQNAKYSVRLMDQEDLEYYGERLIKNDGSLGKYRIEIMFYDLKASSSLAKEYPIGAVHEINDVLDGNISTYKIRIAYPPDDSMFVMYVGSDEPISISEQKSIGTRGEKGIIDIVFQ